VLVQPLAYIIGASLAADGNYLSLLVVMLPMLFIFWARWPLFYWGYHRSVKIIEDISGNSDFNSLREAAAILGLVVVGGFVPSMIGLKVSWTYTQTIQGVSQSVAIQDTLDGVLPYLLPICMVGFCYWLLKSRRFSPVAVIGILAVITFILGALNIVG